MFIFFFCIGLFIAPIWLIGKAIEGKERSERSVPPNASAPRKKDPIDVHMDENYADVDWLRKGKL